MVISINQDYYITGYAMTTLFICAQLLIAYYDRLIDHFFIATVSLIMAAALTIDAIMVLQDIIIFKAPRFDHLIVPYWMWVLWFSFAINVLLIYPWLLKNHLAASISLGFGVPFGYWIGLNINLAELNGPLWLLAIWGIYWCGASYLIGYTRDIMTSHR